MDEAELLGEVEGEGEAARQFSLEEEEALLNGDFEPTTATAAAAADRPVADPPAEVADPPAEIVDPPAEVADPTAVADEDELMNDDSESSKSSEERREPSQDVPTSSNASETGEVDSLTHSVTAQDLRNNSFIRTMFRGVMVRQEKDLERFKDKMSKMEQRMKSQLDELQEEHKNISKQVEDLQSSFGHLDVPPATEPAPASSQQLVLPNAMRRSAPILSAQRLQQLQQLRKRMSDEDAGTSRGVARRFSSDNVQPSTSRGVTVIQRVQHTHHVARKSTGGGRGPGPVNGFGPSRAVVQPQQAQAIASAQQVVAAATATAAARMLAATPSPAQPQRHQQQPIANKMSPHANQAISTPGVIATRTLQQHQLMNLHSSQRPPVFNALRRSGERQTATIAPQSQQAVAISAALAAGDASGSRPSAAGTPALQQQQMNRKRPHPASDGHPAYQQQPLLQTRNGQQLPPPLQHVQPQRQILPQSQQQQGGMRIPQQPLQMPPRPPPACSPDADPELVSLSEYIYAGFQNQDRHPIMQKMHTNAFNALHAASRLEAQLRDARRMIRTSVTMGLRKTDPAFVVPPDGSAPRSKISVDVPEWQLTRPLIRPCYDLPVEAVNRKDEHAPRVEIASAYRDFIDSGKLTGKVHFTPPNDWPESTARICIFFYIATQNSNIWTQSEFATADLKDKEPNGNFKEASVRFIICLDKAKYLAKDARNAVNPIIKFESFVVVPLACAGSGNSAQVMRGDEATFDCEALDQANIQKRYEMLMGQMRQFVDNDKKDRPLQPLVARAARPAGEDDDIIEL